MTGLATTALAWLLFTVPATNQLRYMAPDPANPDSMVLHVECSGGDSTRDLSTVRVYRWNVTGGLAVLDQELDVRGLEGRPDSAAVDPGSGAHFFVTAVDLSGNESCASPVVYKGPVTGVPTSPADAADPIVAVWFFDVQGRLLRGRSWASGVYFALARLKSGRTVRAGKVLVLK